jgi:hypothetical protein
MHCLEVAMRFAGSPAGLWEKPIFIRAMQTNLNVQIQDSGAALEDCQEEVNSLSALPSSPVNSQSLCDVRKK